MREVRQTTTQTDSTYSKSRFFFQMFVVEIFVIDFKFQEISSELVFIRGVVDQIGDLSLKLIQSGVLQLEFTQFTWTQFVFCYKQETH